MDADHKSNPDGTRGFHTWSTSHQLKTLSSGPKFDLGRSQTTDPTSHSAALHSRHILRKPEHLDGCYQSLTILQHQAKAHRLDTDRCSKVIDGCWKEELYIAFKKCCQLQIFPESFSNYMFPFSRCFRYRHFSPHLLLILNSIALPSLLPFC